MENNCLCAELARVDDGARHLRIVPGVAAAEVARCARGQAPGAADDAAKWSAGARPAPFFACSARTATMLCPSDRTCPRNFRVAAANTVWARDMTYISTDEGWLYLVVVLDLFSRRIVRGYDCRCYTDLLASHGIKALMSRKGTAGTTLARRCCSAPRGLSRCIT